jgi:hypothetical protein
MVSPPPNPTKRKRRAGLYLLLGLGLFLAGLFVLLLMLRLGLSRANDRELARIRAEGLPATEAELDKWYPAVPDSENAALIFLEAGLRLRDPVPGGTNKAESFVFPARGVPLSPAEREWIASYLAANREALELTRTASALTRSRYPVDLSPGFMARFAHVPTIENLVRALRLSVESAIAEERSGEAVESIAQILRVASSLDEEPTLVAFLVRLRMLRSATAGLERTLNALSLSEPDLQRLDRVFAAAGQQELLQRVMIGERALILPLFRMNGSDLGRVMGTMTASGRQPTALYAALVSLVRATGILERDMTFYAGAMRTNIAMAAPGPPRSLDLTDHVAAQSIEARRKRCFFSAAVLPTGSKVATRDATGHASLRLARTALAVERFRAARGTLPAQLTELVPDFLPGLPADPFTGEPLQFKRTDPGYLLYSVGADRTDEGGRERVTGSQDDEGHDYDITFQVLR